MRDVVLIARQNDEEIEDDGHRFAVRVKSGIMTSMEVLKVLDDRCLKGYHAYSKGKIGDKFTCSRDWGNPHSKTAIVAKLDSNDIVVGHIPQPLSEHLAPLLDSIEGITITGTITGLPREAREGRWVRGGGLELPCKYVIHGNRTAVAVLQEQVSCVCA